MYVCFSTISFTVRTLFYVYAIRVYNMDIFFNHNLVVGNKKFILTRSTCMENEQKKQIETEEQKKKERE